MFYPLKWQVYMTPISSVSSKVPISMPNDLIPSRRSQILHFSRSEYYTLQQKRFCYHLFMMAPLELQLWQHYAYASSKPDQPLVAMRTPAKCLVGPAPPSTNLGEVWIQTEVPVTGWRFDSYYYGLIACDARCTSPVVLCERGEFPHLALRI